MDLIQIFVRDFGLIGSLVRTVSTGPRFMESFAGLIPNPVVHPSFDGFTVAAGK
jgi:hypothetical protein